MVRIPYIGRVQTGANRRLRVSVGNDRRITHTVIRGPLTSVEAQLLASALQRAVDKVEMLVRADRERAGSISWRELRTGEAG